MSTIKKIDNYLSENNKTNTDEVIKKIDFFWQSVNICMIDLRKSLHGLTNQLTKEDLIQIRNFIDDKISPKDISREVKKMIW